MSFQKLKQALAAQRDAGLLKKAAPRQETGRLSASAKPRIVFFSGLRQPANGGKK